MCYLFFLLCFKPQMTNITGCLITKNYHGLHILEHILVQAVQELKNSPSFSAIKIQYLSGCGKD